LSGGLGTTPFVARIAASRTPAGKVSEIPAGGERAFLDVLPLGVLPLDAKVIEELALLGVRRIGELLALPRGSVTDRFGQFAALGPRGDPDPRSGDLGGARDHRRRARSWPPDRPVRAGWGARRRGDLGRAVPSHPARPIDRVAAEDRRSRGAPARARRGMG